MCCTSKHHVNALRVVFGSQSVSEEVFATVLVEVEGMLNSKPLGYTLSDVANQFWTHFIKDYLRTLQSRQKWEKPSDNLQLDTAVLKMDPQLPRAQWPVVNVTGLHLSPDQCVRSADILVQDRTYTRPVALLISLPELAN